MLNLLIYCTFVIGLLVVAAFVFVGIIGGSQIAEERIMNRMKYLVGVKLPTRRLKGMLTHRVDF